MSKRDRHRKQAAHPVSGAYGIPNIPTMHAMAEHSSEEPFAAQALVISAKTGSWSDDAALSDPRRRSIRTLRNVLLVILALPLAVLSMRAVVAGNGGDAPRQLLTKIPPMPSCHNLGVARDLLATRPSIDLVRARLGAPLLEVYQPTTRATILTYGFCETDGELVRVLDLVFDPSGILAGSKQSLDE